MNTFPLAKLEIVSFLLCFTPSFTQFSAAKTNSSILLVRVICLKTPAVRFYEATACKQKMSFHVCSFDWFLSCLCLFSSLLSLFACSICSLAVGSTVSNGFCIKFSWLLGIDCGILLLTLVGTPLLTRRPSFVDVRYCVRGGAGVFFTIILEGNGIYIFAIRAFSYISQNIKHLVVDLNSFYKVRPTAHFLVHSAFFLFRSVDGGWNRGIRKFCWDKKTFL